MSMHLLLTLIVLFLSNNVIYVRCNTSHTLKKDPIEVFYINLASSIDRNIAMQNHLYRRKYTFKRIDAIQITNEHKQYNLSSIMYPCDHTSNKPMIFHTSILHASSIQVNKLCISPKNILKEIAVVLSHIKAILTALESNNTNEYALILEDDMSVSFDIDFNGLIASTSTSINSIPFSILQLFTINNIDTTKLAEKYIVDNSILMQPWEPNYW